jgi:hypothetical protein
VSASPRAAGQQAPAPLAETTVGMPVELQGVVLPGPPLEAVPPDPEGQRAVVLRVAGAYRHGDAFRYDLVVYALEPGLHDLRESLRPVGGGELDPGSLPPLPLSVVSVLPPGQVLPNPLDAPGAPWLGGYRWALMAVAVLWLAGLVALLRGRKKRRAAVGAPPGAAPPGLAERLRPLVERARDGGLSDDERASLERLVLAFWRRRLGLEEATAAEAVAELKAHPEAGALLRALERWLHAPPGRAGDGDPASEVAQLLAPYRDASDGAPESLTPAAAAKGGAA